MKKASRILLLVGAIVSIFYVVVFGILSIVFGILGSDTAKQVVIDGLKDGSITTSIQGTPEEVAAALQAVFSALSIVFVLFMIASIACAVISFIARAKQNRPMYIVAIVFAVISGTVFGIPGGIFGIVALAQESKANAIENN